MGRVGHSVSISGDTLVIGAYFENSSAPGVNGDQADNSAVNSGAAYLFVRDGLSVWSQAAYLKASNTGANDWFGDSVSVWGDTMVVGALYENSPATGVDGSQGNGAGNSGAAYVFVLPTCIEDVNGDGVVNITDLGIVLGQYGMSGGGLQGDVTGDGNVNISDLGLVLAAFGQSC